jgi:hypothetical protein
MATDSRAPRHFLQNKIVGKKTWVHMIKSYIIQQTLGLRRTRGSPANSSKTRQSSKILKDRHQADLGHGARGTLGLMSLSPPNTKSPFIFKACLVLVYYVNLTPTYPHDFYINSSVFPHSSMLYIYLVNWGLEFE